jgi:tetratricopeptide (TPR) repeat protein
MAYRKQGHRDAAARHFALYEKHKDTQPVVVDPVQQEFLASVHNVKRHLDLAKIKANNGDLEGALKEFEAVLELEPDNVSVRSRMIAAYYRLGRFEEIDRLYKELTELDPDYAEGHYHYGMALLPQMRSKEAEQAFARAIGINAQHAEAQTQYGLLREKAGDGASAMVSYQKAVESKPNLRQAQFLLGRQYVQSGRLDEGIAHLELAVSEEDQRTGWFLRALAGAYSTAGQDGKALEAARRARQMAARYNDRRLIAALDREIPQFRIRAGQ